VTRELSRSSRKKVQSLTELLQLTGCADVNDLQALIESEMSTDPLFVDMGADMTSLQFYTESSGYELPWPFEVGRFWRAIDDLNTDLLHHAEAQGLPEWDSAQAAARDDDPHSIIGDATNDLAEFFGLGLDTFVDHVGGGWFPQDDSELVGLHEQTYRWYGSGQPLQVLLGIGRDEAVVAEPIEHGAGLAGPAWLERGRAEHVLLRREGTLRRLSEQVRDMETLVRSDLHFCAGCRVVLSRGRANQQCRSCLGRYYGMIVD